MSRRKRWLFPVTGFLSLIWFLVRVIPKPSRAAYPCQRAAFPLASGFVLWVAALLGSAALYRRGRALLRQSQWVLACACLVAAAALGIWTVASSSPSAQASLTPNQPIGIAKGVHPGRVVWARDPQATNWQGPGDGHWWEPTHTRQEAVSRMMSQAVRRLGGWDAMFEYFNQAHGNGKTGYRRGEKVAIKVNLVGCIFGNSFAPNSYDLPARDIDYMNTSPQMMVALVGELVKRAGVRQEDISIGDPLSKFPNQYYDLLHAEFPGVRYLDHDGGNAEHPRTAVERSSVPFYWSSRPADKTQDYIPAPFAEAKYLINMANLKAHTMAGVTLCGKNHYGSLFRRPPEKGYYDMHGSLARETKGYGHYRALVDLIGHAHLGGKTLAYFIDGLYPGVHPIEHAPRKWTTFGGQWASSLFASQDPIAIDSVAFDFLWAEWDNYPHMEGADDYLHEAALANDPPSGTFYDPDHPTNTTRLASLGTHEHWNTPQARQYSRNLGKKEGIELLRVESR